MLDINNFDSSRYEGTPRLIYADGTHQIYYRALELFQEAHGVIDLAIEKSVGDAYTDFSCLLNRVEIERSTGLSIGEGRFLDKKMDGADAFAISTNRRWRGLPPYEKIADKGFIVSVERSSPILLGRIGISYREPKVVHATVFPGVSAS